MVYQVRAHRRQFVVGPEPFEAQTGWIHRQLDRTTWLSHCPELRVSWATDSEGIQWVLLGLAVQTLEDAPEPVESVTRNITGNIVKSYQSWAGRWVLIGNNQIHLDASGLLGCYHGKTGDGHTWVSSSPALLSTILFPDTQAEIDTRTLRYEVGLSWFTPPWSRYVGMKRLLPSQILELDSGTIQPRTLMPPIDFSLGFDQVISLLLQNLSTAMRRLPPINGGPWLGLTGGYDSRLMLAIAHHIHLPVRPYTRLTRRMSVADRLLPPLLAQDLGVDHSFVLVQKPLPSRKELVATHCAGNVSDGDAAPFICGARDSLEGLTFGGHGFALASGFWRLRELPNQLTDPHSQSLQLARLFGERSTSSATVGLCQWMEWALAAPQENLDWRDRFFIEQRQAGWLSSKEQMYDMEDVERFPILNSARTYALLLSLEEKQRIGSVAQVEMIRRTAPELLRHPFNPPDSYFGTVRAFTIRLRQDPLRPVRRLMHMRHKLLTLCLSMTDRYLQPRHFVRE